MHPLLLTNVFFEEELSSSKDLLSHVTSHPVHLHLHFLSCLFSKSYKPLLAFAPCKEYCRSMQEKGFLQNGYSLLSDVEKKETLYSFAPSFALTSFAKAKDLLYEIPDKETLLLVHSKEFSFKNSPPLKGGSLLYTEKELEHWWKKTKGPKVLKSFLGVSGRGHFLSNFAGSNLPAAKAFLAKYKEGVVAEPWKKRLLDFSSHWFIDKQQKISYKGSTICINSRRGGYKKTLAGREDLLFAPHLWALEKHKEIAYDLLNKIGSQGFFGSVGIDAMIYEENTQPFLHPIVEVNARNTMGSFALALWKEKKWEEGLAFRYEPSKDLSESLLPSFAIDPRTQKRFSLFSATLEVKKANLACF